jgi:hypothetical protein
MVWYDTTAGLLKFIKTDGTTQSVGGSLSNVIFTDDLGMLDATSYLTVYNLVANSAGTSPGQASPTTPTYGRNYWAVSAADGFNQMRPSLYWNKISGVNTLKCRANWWGDYAASQWSQISFGIGATTAASAVWSSTTPHAEVLTCDISALANGTVYAIDFNGRRQTTSSWTFLGHITIWGE